MIGAILGDIAGSFREFSRTDKYISKGLLPDEVKGLRYGVTDDSLLTLATEHTFLKYHSPSKIEFAESYHEIGNKYRYPIGGFGGGFNKWLDGNGKKPYNSCGNGSAMRVSPVAYVSNDIDKTLELAFESACATHNHPEGIKGAQATAMMIHYALKDLKLDEILVKLKEAYLSYEPIESFDHFDAICPETMRLVMHCLITTDNFHDAVFKAVTIPNADSDTLGAIVGSIAEPLYGIPQELIDKTIRMIPPDLLPIYTNFKMMYNI